MYGIIYMTTCLVNGRKYIGQHKCKNINDRYLGSGAILKMAIKEYGAENFIRQTLCVCESEEELNQKEIEYIAKYNATESLEFYNICEGGKANRMVGELNPMYGMRGELAPSFGRHPSEEELKKMSERMKGENNPMYGYKYTDEEKKAIGDRQRGDKHWNYGKHWSDEVKDKISSSNKGKPGWNKGIPMSEEAKRKLSESRKGQKLNLSEETKAKKRDNRIEQNHTDKFKKQVSEANKRFHEEGGRRGGKPVLCLETNIVYASGYDACRAINCSKGLIAACLRGAQKTAKGYHWRYATEEESLRAVIA